jgi:hypothetical protein
MNKAYYKFHPITLKKDASASFFIETIESQFNILEINYLHILYVRNIFIFVLCV